MIIHSSDIIELPGLPNPQSLHPALKFEKPVFSDHCFHPRIGTIHFKNDFFAHMHIMELRWQAEEDILWNETDSSQNININFHLRGALDTSFCGISNQLNMRPAKHNLVFSPEGGFTNQISGGDSIEMFHLSIDKDFFANAIGCDDAWSERVQNQILKNKPFTGAPGTPEITVEMQRIINEIRGLGPNGPMRNLMLQSKTLELLAMQIEQFRSPSLVNDFVRYDEAEKLNALKTHLDNHFLEEFTLTDLGRLSGLNEFKLKKGFKMMFGNTVFGYLRALRMEYAKRLLLDNALTVEEVADILGYEYAQHFSIAFKKFTGQNPSVFARKSGLVKAVA